MVVRYGVAGDGSPTTGKKYLFFLSAAKGGGYEFVTAYEMRGEGVRALDAPRGGRVPADGDGSAGAGERDYQGFKDAVIAAFTNWQSSNGPGGNNTGVTFTFTDTEAGTNSHTVRRQAPSTPVRGSTEIAHTNGVISGAWTELSSTVTSYAAILEVMVHEVGHGMGLDDCYSCSTSASVMSGGPPVAANPNTVVGRPTSPTACDNPAVSAGAAPPPTGGGGGGGLGDDRNEIPEGWFSCTPSYRHGIISYDGGKTWYLEYSVYDGCW